MGDYSHPGHGDMEWRESNGFDKQVKGWRCVDCHVVAEPERADEVFDDHDCEQYEKVRKGVTGSL